MISRMRWMEKRSEHRRLRGFTDRQQPMFGKSAPELSGRIVGKLASESRLRLVDSLNFSFARHPTTITDWTLPNRGHNPRPNVFCLSPFIHCFAISFFLLGVPRFRRA